MMPLTLASDGEENIIRQIGGTPEVKHHLENLGFVVGGNVRIISRSVTSSQNPSVQRINASPGSRTIGG